MVDWKLQIGDLLGWTLAGLDARWAGDCRLETPGSTFAGLEAGEWRLARLDTLWAKDRLNDTCITHSFDSLHLRLFVSAGLGAFIRLI